MNYMLATWYVHIAVASVQKKKKLLLYECMYVNCIWTISFVFHGSLHAYNVLTLTTWFSQNNNRHSHNTNTNANTYVNKAVYIYIHIYKF